jgi:hypothetical protein
LSYDEQARLEACEAVVERGLMQFVEVGTALAEIRDSRLYRTTHRNFTDYCRTRWGISDSRAHQLVRAAEVVAELENCTTVQSLPTSEAQVRELARVEPAQRAEVWTQAQEQAKAEAKPVAARHVQQATKPQAKPPEPEPEPEDDIVAELEAAHRQITEMQKVVDSMLSDDKAKEILRLTTQLAQLNANHQTTVAELAEVRKEHRWMGDYLHKIRQALKVAKNSEIIPAIDALRA